MESNHDHICSLQVSSKFLFSRLFKSVSRVPSKGQEALVRRHIIVIAILYQVYKKGDVLIMSLCNFYSNHLSLIMNSELPQDMLSSAHDITHPQHFLQH